MQQQEHCLHEDRLCGCQAAAQQSGAQGRCSWPIMITGKVGELPRRMCLLPNLICDKWHGRLNTIHGLSKCVQLKQHTPIPGSQCACATSTCMHTSTHPPGGCLQRHLHREASVINCSLQFKRLAFQAFSKNRNTCHLVKSLSICPEKEQ